jgi:hypothetical protein
VTGVVRAIVVVVGSVVPEACSMFVGGVKGRLGRVGALRSPEHAATERSASKPASTRGNVRMRGSVVRCIPGRGTSQGGKYSSVRKGDRKEKAPYSA